MRPTPSLRSAVRSLPICLSLVACGDQAAPTKDQASAATTTTASAAPTARPAPTSSATAPAPATASASAATSASAAPLVPAEQPAAEAPSAEAFTALEKEIAVRASGEQKCSTKVLQGWFEIVCGPADGLVRPTKVELLSGFDASKSNFEEVEKSVSFRWVAALPASGQRAQARFSGPKLHEIFLTLDHTDKGWKGQLSGKKPE